MKEKTAIIILAAGNSSRLGKPKQLLDVQGKKLLIHAVDEACKSNADNVFVVLGSDNKLLTPILMDYKVDIIINDHWDRGMGNSIKRGVSEMILTGIFESVIISVCDQPYLTKEIFNKLIAQQDMFEIVASAYPDGNYGPPTLFNKSQYHNLLEIQDFSGAKSLIKNFKGELGLVPFDKGEIDLDTLEDYQSYLNSVK
ncbi:MAG: NTP transferase domain-containing protein [Bacteroidota bacterium]